MSADGEALAAQRVPARTGAPRALLGMTTVLALRNLFHDRTRLAVTLIGIAFAVVLINVQLGLFIGFSRTTSALIDRAGADLWITASGTRNVDQSIAISERKLFQARTVPGVAHVAKQVVEFVLWKKPDGGTESVLVVGFDTEQRLGGPWNLIEGDLASLRFPNTVIVDWLYREKLGVQRLGEVVEINGVRARIVGFTRGIRSFTQSPYVFTSAKNALDYARLRADQVKFGLVTIQPGIDPRSIKATIAADLADVDVHTSAEFSDATRRYWMFTTGAGLALLLAAAMGLAVGIVIVSQTLYATTVDHLAEFGTLKAIGASNGYVHAVIIKQAVVAALIGYVLGWIVTQIVLAISGDSGPAIALPAEILAATFVLTLIMCVGASLISVHKVKRLDPMIVFNR